MITDRIAREITINAPVERVWDVITQPEHVGTWFGDAGAEIDLRRGGAMSITWTEHGTGLCVVEAVDPPRTFAFRWTHGDGVQPEAGNTTLVTFTLTPDGDTTRLQVVETGFATVDGTDDDRAARHADNTHGWTIKLEEARVYTENLAA